MSRRGVDGVTVDTLRRGRVTIVQTVRGARTSLDPLLLADFLGGVRGRVLDLGAGTGALGLLLAEGNERATVLAVEIQTHLADLARQSVERSGLAERVTVLAGDARSAGRAVAAAGFDVVASNPPYRAFNRGRTPANSERALAHHEVTLTLAECLDVCRRAVKPGGRVGLVYPAERLVEMLAGLSERGLAPVRLRLVHPRAGAVAGRALIEAVRGKPRPLRVEPPLIVHEGRAFSADVRAIVEGR